MRDLRAGTPCACPSCCAVYSGAEDWHEEGWERVEGEWYCPDCVDYSTSPSGEVLCGSHDIPDYIEWGPIVTGPPGAPNRQYGRSKDGRRWITEDRGGWTVPAPLDD
jgi:hypothetical protein